MGRSRIHDDQVVDEGFVSEREFNDFHGQVVITGTEGTDDTELTTSFDNYLPGRGIFVGADGNVVSTGTNTIQIASFYNEFVASSGSLQSDIDGLGGGGNIVTSITASGVTITGAVTLASIEGIDLIPDIGTSTITISGTFAEGGGSVDPPVTFGRGFFHGYTTSTTSLAATFTPIPLDVQVVASGFSHTPGDSEVIADSDGVYDITYYVTTDMTVNTRSDAENALQVDTGGGFITVPGSLSINYGRQASQGGGNSAVRVAVVATSGDKFRVVSRGNSGSTTNFEVLPGYAGLTISDAQVSLNEPEIIINERKLLYIYEGTGGQVIGTDTVVTFDTDQLVDSEFSFTGGGSEVTFNEAGTYEVTYVVSIEALSGGTGGGQRSNADTWMEADTGGGFTEIPGTRAMQYVRGSVYGGVATQTYIRDYVVGDKIRVIADDTNGLAPQTVKPNGASLTVRDARASGQTGAAGPAGDTGGSDVDAIVGGVGIVVTSGSNETVIDGHLRYQKSENDAIIGGDNVTVVSGAETITISSVDTDTVSDAIIGGIGITVTSGSNETTIEGHLRYQKNENDAILGTDGNTVISGAQTITIQGFRPEFVSASGSLQSQIDAVEGSDVDSVNSLIGDITIAPGYNTTVETAGQTITVGTFDDDDVDSITASGVTVTGSVQFETLGGISVTADAGTDTVTISGGAEVGALTGSLFQVDFTNGGNTSNTWLAVSDSNLGGNTTPWTAAFPCRLAGVAFSNRNDDVNLDMEFHIAREGDGNSSTTEFVYEIRACRTGYKTDMPLTTLLLQPGDKVSVYAQNAGDSGRDVWFGSYWEITSRPAGEGCEDWTGNIS